jgi:hypothetical protein
MNAQRAGDTRAASPTGSKSGRKPWKKKTAVEVVFEQTEKIRLEIKQKEDELKSLRDQLQKFEQARKIFEVA